MVEKVELNKKSRDIQDFVSKNVSIKVDEGQMCLPANGILEAIDENGFFWVNTGNNLRCINGARVVEIATLAAPEMTSSVIDETEDSQPVQNQKRIDQEKMKQGKKSLLK